MTSSSKLVRQTVYYLLFASIGASLAWIPDPQTGNAVTFGSIQLAGPTAATMLFIQIKTSLRSPDLAPKLQLRYFDAGIKG